LFAFLIRESAAAGRSVLSRPPPVMLDAEDLLDREPFF